MVVVGHREANTAQKPAVLDTDTISGTKAKAKPNASAPRVTQFLHRIRGLHSLSDAELEELLYERRFELLPAPKQPLPGIPGEGAQTLPTHDSIPSQQELHEALLGTTLPGGFQCVANILYPESVEWPAHCQLTGPDTAGEVDNEGCANGGGEVTSQPVSPSGPGSPAAQDQPPSAGGMLTASLTEDSMGHTKSNEATGDDLSPRRPKKDSPRRAASVKIDSVVLQRADTAVLPCEVTVCGLRIASTLRGLPVPPPLPAEAKTALYVDEAKYKAAREKKRRLEKALKIETYREKRCCEKIESLEQMKLAETTHLEELRKREARREERMQALKAQLEKDVNRKEEEEKEKAKEVERSREKAKKTEQKWQEHRKRLKELMEENEGRTLEEREALRKAALEELRPSKDERPKPKTKKQAEAEDRAVRMRASVEQRPPLPPRSHDMPAPPGGLDMGLAAQKARPPRFGSWVVQAKGVSGTYGLSPRDHASVEGNLMRAVKGSGRMAQYER